MAMKRTTVFADERDLAVLKLAAEHRGVAEAELIREAIHLAAMANQAWSEPLFSRTFEPVGNAVGDVWDDRAEAYEKAKRAPR